jgi:hypothetical protein
VADEREAVVDEGLFFLQSVPHCSINAPIVCDSSAPTSRSSSRDAEVDRRRLITVRWRCPRPSRWPRSRWSPPFGGELLVLVGPGDVTLKEAPTLSSEERTDRVAQDRLLPPKGVMR